MSGTTSSRTGMTRRSFMKGAAAAGALGIAAGGMATTANWLAPAQAVAEPEEKTIYTIHQFMCTGNCLLKCTIRDGRLAKIEPNDTVDKEYRKCCMKGLSEIQHVYGDERLQTPMRRVGERGEGKFEAITWDEAMQVVGEELKKAWDKYGHETVYISKSNEPRFGFLAPLLGAATGVEPGIDRGTGNGLDPSMGNDGFGNATSDARDWVNSKTLIMSGCNFFESSMMQSSFFLDAKKAGCETIVLDPHFSTTASKAHQWVPIKPGTDPAFYLAMTSYVLDNGFYDEDFIRAHTTLPCLVSVDDGTMLTDGGEAKYLVWDAKAKAAAPLAEAYANAALEGEFTVDGKKYTPAFARLKETQKPYTSEWASEITGIPAETIDEIARKYACNGPAVLAFGQGGSDKHSNNDVTGHAGAILTALTGNVGKPGASVGHFIGGGGWGAGTAAWPIPEKFQEAQLPVRADRFPTRENDVHVIISLGNTLQQYYANMNKTREWLKSLDFILHVGMYHEDSVDYADIVLPVCSKFEDTVEHGIYHCGFNHMLLQTKCIDPLFESKPDFEVMKLILESVGLGDYLPEDAEELVRYEIDNADDPALEGITVDALVENHGSMLLKGADKPRIGFADLKFNTPTQRMEVYYENMLPVDQALPTWVPNNEAFEGNPLAEQYPLQFTQTRTRFFIHSHFRSAKWLHQYYTPYLELNPAELASRGLADGDAVEVYNDRGSFKCYVRANNAVRPGSSRIYEASWSKYVIEGNPQNVTNDYVNERDEYLMTGAPIPFNDTLVQVRKA